MERTVLSRTCDSCGFVEVDQGRIGERRFAHWWSLAHPGTGYGTLTLHACSDDCAKLLLDTHGTQQRSQRKDHGPAQTELAKELAVQ